MSPTVRRRFIGAVTIAALFGGQTTFAVLAEPRPRTPPPTPVNGQPSAFPSTLHTPADPVARPGVDARAALLFDVETGAVLYRKAATTRRAIASLTKVMTALLTLRRTELDDVVRVSRDAVYDEGAYGESSTLGLRAGERITVENLLYGLLLGSANDAADALAIHVSGGEDRFVRAMNRSATRLGMRSTRFFSPSGLDDRGRSTAADLLRLVRTAEDEPAFRTIVATRFRSIPAPKGRDRRIQNRNALLWLYPGTTGTKTGFTAAAGSCLVATARREGRRLIVIMLGASGEPFSDAATLLDHGFEGFTRETVVHAGEQVGMVRLRGGTVPVVAGDALDAWIPTAAMDDVETTTTVAHGVAFPPAPGDTVGTYSASVPGLALGSVPILVSAVPPPHPVEGPWWVRAAITIGRAVETAIGSFAN